MNNLMLLVVLGVAFVYCGGSNVPAVFRNNKQLLGGVVVGLFLCSFFGLRLEGFDGEENDAGFISGEDAPEGDGEGDKSRADIYKTAVKYGCGKKMLGVDIAETRLDKCRSEEERSGGRYSCPPERRKRLENNYREARQNFATCIAQKNPELFRLCPERPDGLCLEGELPS